MSIQTENASGRKWFVLLTLVGLLMIGGFFLMSRTTSVSATTFGGRWPTASTSYHSYSRYSSEINAAKSSWNTSTDFYLYEVPPFSAQVSIHDTWTSAPWSGYSYVSPSWWSTYQSGLIYLNRRVFDFCPGCFNYRQAIVSHEFGHIIGLNHAPSTQIVSIMLAGMGGFNLYGLTGPAQYDIDDVNSLY